jgi:RNA 3'-terminal phosphate cyclase (ATP)
MDPRMLVIDGSYGEGGGQIVRSALALSVITGRPVEIRSIRAGRTKPGLRPQHLTAVQAAAGICGADVSGCRLGSQSLRFKPGKVKPGDYHFGIGTAGSVMLILQTVVLPLASAQESSRITLTGGTHVPWSPCFHYVDLVFRPAVASMGILFEVVLQRAGWYPKGGGVIRATIHPSGRLSPFRQETTSGPAAASSVLSASSNLPGHVRRRQADRVRALSGQRGILIPVEERELPADSPGSVVFCCTVAGGRFGGFTGLGARGKPAEQVADEAVLPFLAFLEGGTQVDSRLSDQLVAPAALADGESLWSVDSATRHLRTNIWVAEQLSGRKFDIIVNNKKDIIIRCYS